MSQPINELIEAVEDILPDIWDEIEQRRHSGNDENWRPLDKKAGRLARATRDVEKHEATVAAHREDLSDDAADPVRISRVYLESLETLWDQVSDAVESPDSGLKDAPRKALTAAIARCQAAQAVSRDDSNGLGEDWRIHVIERARTTLGDDELEFDDDARLSVADDAVWVQGWARLTNDEIGRDNVFDEESVLPG